MGVIFVWCAHWTQSFNSPVAHSLGCAGWSQQLSLPAKNPTGQQQSAMSSWGKLRLEPTGVAKSSLTSSPIPDRTKAPSPLPDCNRNRSAAAAQSHFPPLEEPLLNLTYICCLYQLHLLWFLNVHGEFSKVISPLFCHYKSMSANDRRLPLTPMHQNMYFLYCKCP